MLIYLVVVQSVLMYRSETWVLTPRIQKVLVRFHHRVDRRLTWQQPWKGRKRGWLYLTMEDAMTEVGLQEEETYISR